MQKLRWYQAGGKVSDRQWRDVIGIILVQGAQLDRELLQSEADELGLSHLLARALAHAGNHRP